MQENLYQEIDNRLQHGESCNMITRIEISPEGKYTVSDKYVIGEEAEAFSRIPFIQKEKDAFVFHEPVAPKERLILYGGGHVSRALCAFAAQAGFSPWIVEDRPEFAGRDRFPDAQKILCQPFPEAWETITLTPQDYVAILTRGHHFDGECLWHILNGEKQPGYLGMIGSKKRVQAQFASFRARGMSAEKLDTVHTPIGLDIGAVTPEEIAIAILAELIAVKRKGRGREGVCTDLEQDIIQELAACQEPAVVATILSSTGSTPRKAGAKMLIMDRKKIKGTIGGGLGESLVIDRAVALLGTGRADCFHYVLNHDVDSEEGMACGGTMDVLLEDICLNKNEKNREG